MKIAIHSNQFDGRGTGKTPYDYGVALRDILGHEVVYITTHDDPNEGLPRIGKEFPVFQYNGNANRAPAVDVKRQIEKIVSDQKIDFVQMMKSGANDFINPENCKTGTHYIFDGKQPHGNVFAAVSNALARKFGLTAYVPHIIQRIEPNKDIRAALNIPKDALVIGRHGGKESFDLAFVHRAVEQVLKTRKDVYFLFLSTNPFINHERAIFFPWVSNEIGIFNFINACDVMLHARHMGETFGLSVGEFSVSNKPVITWSGKMPWSGEINTGYDTAHLDHLGNKALLYDDFNSLVKLIGGLDVNFIRSQNWDMFTEKFSPKSVITQYKDVFLT
jgi:hypothetical protein